MPDEVYLAVFYACGTVVVIIIGMMGVWVWKELHSQRGWERRIYLRRIEKQWDKVPDDIKSQLSDFKKDDLLKGPTHEREFISPGFWGGCGIDYSIGRLEAARTVGVVNHYQQGGPER